VCAEGGFLITPAFRIIHLRGQLTLFCLLCNQFSTDPEDVMQRYCLFCGKFLDEVPEDYRLEAPTQPRKRRVNG